MGFTDYYLESRMSSLEHLQGQSDEVDAAIFEQFRQVLDRRRQELDATILFCHTVYEYLRRKGLLDEAEFKAIYDELDLKDGQKNHRGEPLPATEGKAGG